MSMDNLVEHEAKHRFRGWTPLAAVPRDLLYLSNLSDSTEEFHTVEWYLPVKGLLSLHLADEDLEGATAYLGCWADIDSESSMVVDQLVAVAAQSRRADPFEQSNLVDPNLDSEKRAAGWLPRAFDRLQELMLLPTGWDGEGSTPVTPAAASSAFALLNALASRMSLEPALIPTREGRLQLEWHEPTAHLEVEIAADGASVEMWYHDVLSDSEREETIKPTRIAIGEIDALLAVIESRA